MNYDSLLFSISQQCKEPLTQKQQDLLLENKKILLKDTNKSFFFVLLEKNAHKSWYDFYFQTYSIKEICRANSKEREKYVIKYVSLLLGKRDFALLHDYYQWLKRDKFESIVLDHGYSKNKNICHMCIEYRFIEALEFFHQKLPNYLQEVTLDSKGRVYSSFTTLTENHSGIKPECLEFVLKHIDFQIFTKNLASLYSRANYLKQIEFYDDSELTKQELTPSSFIHHLLLKIVKNIAYFPRPSNLNNLLANYSLEPKEKKQVIMFYRQVLEKLLFGKNTTFDLKEITHVFPSFKSNIRNNASVCREVINLYIYVLENSMLFEPQIKTQLLHEFETLLEVRPSLFQLLPQDARHSLLSYLEKIKLEHIIDSSEGNRITTKKI